jgi:poly(3-hydroxybutyrate) depolymerase
VLFDQEFCVKVSTLSLSLGMAGFLLGGCHLYNNDNNSTACSGYLGCSGGSKSSIGVAPQPVIDAGAMEVGPLSSINMGCGVDPFAAGQLHAMTNKPTGYTHYTVQGTGATLLQNIPSKVGPRTFWVRLPVDYDMTKKYRTVYIGQGCGGYGVANTQTYALYNKSMGGDDEAIYVALDIPTDHANMDCYDNRDGPSSQEWEAFQLIHTFVDQHFCVDNDRVYVSGYSTGGWLQNMWGCYFAGDGEHPWNGKPGGATVDAGAGDAPMSQADASDAPLTSDAPPSSDAPLTSDAQTSSDASPSGDGPATMSDAGGSDGGGDGESNSNPDVGVYVPGAGARKFAPQYHIRAQAGTSGGEPDNNPPCNGPIAALWIHDKMDPNAYTANHDIALPRVLKMNGCYSAKPPTAPWHEDVMGIGVCVEYTDCPPDYPVVFCTTNMYGHGAQDSRAVPGFTLLFKELESHMTAK